MFSCAGAKSDREQKGDGNPRAPLTADCNQFSIDGPPAFFVSVSYSIYSQHGFLRLSSQRTIQNLTFLRQNILSDVTLGTGSNSCCALLLG